MKLDFEKWSGFSLKSTDKEGIMNEIKQRQWDLECEVHQEAKTLRGYVNKLFPED